MKKGRIFLRYVFAISLLAAACFVPTASLAWQVNCQLGWKQNDLTCEWDAVDCYCYRPEIE